MNLCKFLRWKRSFEGDRSRTDTTTVAILVDRFNLKSNFDLQLETVPIFGCNAFVCVLGSPHLVCTLVGVFLCLCVRF